MQNKQHVGDAELASLVFDELDGPSTEGFVEHIESCTTCQTRHRLNTALQIKLLWQPSANTSTLRHTQKCWDGWGGTILNR